MLNIQEISQICCGKPPSYVGYLVNSHRLKDKYRTRVVQTVAKIEK